MQILITGGTGYLGGRLANLLRRSGHTVTALTRAERELAALGSRVAAVDAVIHTACCYGRAGESRAEIFAANVDWPSRLLTMLLPSTLFLNADTVLPAGLNRYAASKEWFRAIGPALAGTRDARWINLRLEQFFGPGEGSDKFITRTVRACLAGSTVDLTPGEQRRDFVFIDDAAGAFELVLRIAAAGGDVRNVHAATGRPVRIREVAERIHRLCGGRGTLRFGALAYREGEPMELERPDAEPLERYGWRAAVDLQQGLERVVQFEKTREADPCVCS